MAHFAKLNSDDLVTQVVVVDNEVLNGGDIENERLGIDFLFELTGHAYWRQTSYSASFRKNYAGIGYTYRADIDAFIPPSPGPGFVLNEETGQWEPET